MLSSGKSRLLVLLFVAGLFCHGAAQAQITRKKALQTAEAYATFLWTPTERNAFHGLDAEGVQVDTPDVAFRPRNVRPGWWKPHQPNRGVPYMWGGFSSLEEFAAGLRAGKFAGDIYTAQKRQLLDQAVSKHVVGIDCSGLISRCWGLERSYSTREFPGICVALGSYAELKPGDILNSFNNHVLLFKAFKDPQGQRILAYEAGSPPTWKVLLNDIPVTMLKGRGYLPYRFKGIRD